MTDPYQVLGVSPTASDDEVKKAYRTLCKRYHPDANVGKPDAAQAEKKFMEVQQAYEEIMHRRQGGGQRAGLPDFEQRAEEQYGASRDEEDRDGRRSEDPHAADADAERGDEREDDHHEGDAEVRQFAREGAGRGVVEGSHGVLRCVFRFGLCLRVQI